MTNDLKLYTFKLCPFAHRVRLALAEKELSAEMIEIDLRNKPSDFTSISPHGRVPLLVHGDKRIWESAVIVEYLDETFPVPPLMPTAPFDRAVARLLVDFANSRLFAATHRLIFERDDTQRRVLVEQMKSDVRFLEETWHGRKRGGPYILGSQFTLADIALYPWFEQLATLQKLSAFRLPSDCRNVRDWSAAVAARPAVKKCSQTEGWYEAGYRDYLAA